MPNYVQIGPLPLNEIFFGKINNIVFMYLLSTFIQQNFKKHCRADWRLQESIILGPRLGP